MVRPANLYSSLSIKSSLLAAFLFVTLASCFGCTDGSEMASARKRARSVFAEAAEGRQAEMGKFDKGKTRFRMDAASNGEKDSANELAPSETSNATANRKIIYTARVKVVVEDFAGVPQSVQSLVNQHGGFVSMSNVGSMQGRSRSGSWTIRIPVDQYQRFLAATGDIGQTASLSQNADDVSEEFFDAQARVSNKKKLEDRIVKLLEKSDHKIQHVIEVERELGRVREEIERIEGRIRYLTDRTSLTTVNLDIREQRNYVPETAATFTSRISTAWSQSLTRFRLAAENLIVFAVGNFLGFCVFAVVVLVGFFVLRRFLSNTVATS